jgi:hypothetical protein
MARCPSCQHQVSVLFYSFRSSVLLRNMFRSPAGKIYVCKNCGENLTMATQSFIFCQVAFIVIVTPCAIGFARLQTWLVNSYQLFHQLSAEFPHLTVVILWIFPTLIVTLFVYNELAKHFVDFQKAE